MTDYSFDANILIDALAGYPLAHEEIRRAGAASSRVWISRMAWIEVISKGSGDQLRDMSEFLGSFAVDEIDSVIADQAAALRRERPRLKSPDAVILASAQVRGRILITRNTRDFPANMPGVRIPYTI